MDLGGYVNVAKLESTASPIKTVGDLQPVVEGTGAELCGLNIKVMESVGCPSWLTRLGESRENPARFSVYLCCFDAGGECQSHPRRVHRDFGMVAPCENVALLCAASGSFDREKYFQSAEQIQLERRRQISVAHPLLYRRGVDIQSMEVDGSASQDQGCRSATCSVMRS